MKIAVLQCAYLGMSPNKLDYYLRICRQKDVKLLLLGEYVLNRFFKEIENTPLNMLKEQTNHQINTLKELSSKYDITIVAPIIQIQKNNIFKKIVVSSSNKIQYYTQQMLINFKHWNEEKFFSNDQESLNPPLTFKIDNIKFGVIGGYELHFNYFFDEFSKKNVDVVLLPTVSTFDSNIRWQEIIKTRAFLGNFYILRANRIGEYIDKEIKWIFYGESLLASPEGKIENMLSNKEELLICDIDKNFIKENKKAWGFKRIFNKKAKK
ncbi:carbon-nitrogen hydrolase family protein [Nitrosophilus kaiyonis]|uniref:carbon-nitrogen hydrolase family protein n=1 Tax=Nitrosophilus kaiyonis TaxID=2930200 RepID=UPI002491FF64|nr:carbon-nitrogen hydrolase family protein [Nitrosophilus kaiyonis]